MTARIVLATLCLAVAAGAARAGEVHLARNLAATCTGCHGTAGKSSGGMEPLAGEPQETLLRKMHAFRSGDKPATIMHQIARGYTDQQLELIAAWFAAQR